MMRRFAAVSSIESAMYRAPVESSVKSWVIVCCSSFFFFLTKKVHVLGAGKTAIMLALICYGRDSNSPQAKLPPGVALWRRLQDGSSPNYKEVTKKFPLRDTPPEHRLVYEPRVEEQCERESLCIYYYYDYSFAMFASEVSLKFPCVKFTHRCRTPRFWHAIAASLQR